MRVTKRLPDAEYNVMRAIWNLPSPTTSSMILSELSPEKSYKLPTLITLLNRLIERGFISTSKQGRERLYYCEISREEYIQFESTQFAKKFKGDAFTAMAVDFCQSLDDDELDELMQIIQARRRADNAK